MDKTSTRGGSRCTAWCSSQLRARRSWALYAISPERHEEDSSNKESSVKPWKTLNLWHQIQNQIASTTTHINILCFPDFFFLQIRSILPVPNNGENLKQIIISLIIDQAKETNPFDLIKHDRPLQKQLKEDPNLVPLTGSVTQICR